MDSSMRVAQYKMVDDDWRQVAGPPGLTPQLVLVFFAPNHNGAARALHRLAEKYPQASIAGCTTGGEILGSRMSTDAIVAAAVEFEHSTVTCEHHTLADRRNSWDVGRNLAKALRGPDLKGILILADGLDTNGTALVSGMREEVGDDPVLFGGLAGDGLDFIITRLARRRDLIPGVVTAIGLYGPKLRISHASASGWTPSGSTGNITHYVGSILYEIDHRPALDWLRDQSGSTTETNLADLLIKPLWIASNTGEAAGVIRSVIGLDQSRGYLVLAGEIPGHLPCRLMHGSAGGLIGGALSAARALGSAPPPDSSLAIVISCIGRRLALGDHAADEALAIGEALGAIPQIGFYAYGEIGRLVGARHCDFHNQTMAVTVLSENT